MQPHEDHFGHVLSTTDREIEDHHFEPVSVRRDIIHAKHRARRNKVRRRRHLSNLMKASSERTVSDIGQEAEVSDTRVGMELPDQELADNEPPISFGHGEGGGSDSLILPAIETDV